MGKEDEMEAKPFEILSLTREEADGEIRRRIIGVPDFAAMFSGYDGPQSVEDGAARHPMGAEEQTE